MKNKVLSYSYSKEVVPGADSNLAKSEDNDCVVKAFASASGTHYEDSHKFVKKVFKRKNKKGTMFIKSTLEKKQTPEIKIGNKEFKFKILPTSRVTNTYKLYGEYIEREKTVKSFIKDNQKGTYVVLVSGHAFTVKDGVLIDNPGEEFRPTRKVQDAIQLIRINDPVGKQLKLF